MFSFERDWLQPYIPHSLTHAASILADHVDFWEEETFRSTDGWYRPRLLTTFLNDGLAADKKMETRFRELLEEYIALATSKGTVRARPGDQSFQITRRHSVQIAIADVRLWLDVRRMPTPGLVGRKRARDEI